MRNSNRFALLALLALALHATRIRADDGALPIFSFSAFGTLGVVHSSERRADFTSTAAKPVGAGFSQAWSAEPDSILGAQINARFTPRLSGVLQFDAEQTADHTYRPDVEWANLKYQFTPDFSARVGRTVLPGLMLAATRKIGYAYPWVRPPVEVYDQVPVTFNDGIDASYRVASGAAINTFQLSMGRTDAEFPGDSILKARKLFVAVYTLERGFLATNASYGQARVTLSTLDPLMDGFRQFGPEGAAIADRYDLNDGLAKFYSLGATYDPADWFVTGEFQRVVGDGILGRRTGWYLSGGYRFGKLTPYVTYARADADNLSDPGLGTAGLPPFLVGPVNDLNAGLNATLAQKMVQNTLSVGARWDMTKNSALKMQFDHTRIGEGSAGSLTNRQPGFLTGGKFTLFSASVNFVFK